MRKAKLFIINLIILTGTAILMQTIGISFSVYVSNKVGAESIGLFQLIMSVYAFAITLATSGISLASTRIVSEEIAKGNEQGAKKAIRQCIFFSLICGMIASTLILVFSGFIINVCLHNRITITPLYFIAFSLPFLSMSASINGYFSATRKVFKTASSQLLEILFKIVLTVTLLNIYLPKGLDYACICLVIGTCVCEAFSFFYIFILYLIDKRKLGNKEKNKNSYVKPILNICVPIAITSYIRSGLSTLKQLIVPVRLEKSGLTCSQALSKYGLVSGMVLPILLFPSVFINSFAGLIIPEFSSLFVTKNYKRINTLTSKIFKTTFLFSAGVFGLFLTFYDDLGRIIYNSSEVAKFLLYLSPAVLIMYIDTVVDGMLRGLNEQVNVMKCNILDLFVSTTLLYFLLPIYSIYGYIIVIYISELLNGIISIRQLVKVTKLNIKYFAWILKPVGAALITRYIITLIHLNEASNMGSLVIKMILFLGIYLIILFITGSMNQKDLKV
ncbi:MAG: oligosaccharide flippase family protein [Clostridia bacterium]|nr:oligosaccharide flippase family protein [Clostridia bacterium]